MELLTTILSSPVGIMMLLFGLYMAWNIGANDVANAMGTSVGSGALTLRRAIIVAAVLEFAGAYFAGSHVTDTVRKGIVDPALFTDSHNFALGMLASLLAAGAWLQVASYFGWPVSTTHTIVGAVVGFAAVHLGVSEVNWDVVGKIVASWVVSPLMSGTIAFLLFHVLTRLVFRSSNPAIAARKLTPKLVFVVSVVLTLVLFWKGLKHIAYQPDMGETLIIACVVGVIAAVLSHFLLMRLPLTAEHAAARPFHESSVSRSLRKARKHLVRVVHADEPDTSAAATALLADLDELTGIAEGRNGSDKPEPAAQYESVERIFSYLQIFSACFVAFAHGANDVANAIGPMAAITQVLRDVPMGSESEVPSWLLMLGGFGIVFGLATWGWRVIETIGKRLTELTPTRGFAAEFAAATTIVLASKLSMPISTTHTLVGAVLGVGLARGIGALNLRMVRDIITSWVVTVPAGAVLSIVFFYILSAIF